MCAPIHAQEKHPHILVNEQDKKIILDKITHQPWANEIVKRMEKELMPYVQRHQKDPEWILLKFCYQNHKNVC